MKKSQMVDGDQFARIAMELGLVYVATHELRKKNLIDDIRAMPGKINVLSANSDGGIPAPGVRVRSFDFVWEGMLPNVNIWFSQNVDVREDRLIPIPIGLECDKWNAGRKKEVILATPIRERSRLVYMNHMEWNPTRTLLYAKFENAPWCTTQRIGKGMGHYYNQLASHKFVFSPDGNGYDCCRTWEALYLGCYPIVQRHVFTEEFAKQLPLLIVDDWDIVTEDYLNAKYYEFTNGQVWNWDALDIQYWENLIKDAIR